MNGACEARSDGAVAIRRAIVADAVALSAFAARVFHDTFAPDNDPADMQRYLAETFTPEKQTAELADPACVCLIADVGEAMAGYALLRVGSTDPCVSGARPVEIQRFYIDHRWHGRGLAAQLMAACVDTAGARGGETVWLGVWERNARAIRFYGKHGFADVGTHDFLLGRDLQTDRVMTRPVVLSR